LSPATSALLVTQPVGDSLTLMNQMLLQDAYAGQYQKAPLAPATVTIVKAFNPATPTVPQGFDGAMMTDLNALITGGVSIYTPDRFAPWAGAIDPNSELGMLMTNTAPTAAQLIRENRLLLELAYSAELRERAGRLPAGAGPVGRDSG